MIAKSDPATPSSDDRAQRRWFIGIAITLLFGMFGAVMAVLAYTNNSSAPAASGAARGTAPSPGSAATAVPAEKPDRDHRGKDRSHK